MGSHRLVEVVAHRVGQGADGIVEDEQVLVLVLAEGKNEGVQDVAEVRHQLRAGLLLQGGEGTVRGEGFSRQPQAGLGSEWGQGGCARDQPVRIREKSAQCQGS